MIPESLAAVAKLAADGESFDLSLRNFLDGFYARPTFAGLEREPQKLAGAVPELGAVEDAYLAAVAEWLAWKYDLSSPAWVFESDRFLHRPWFASQLGALRGLLLLESPAPFRSRNLFVTENALARA